MTVETKLPVDQDYVSSYSKQLGEPEWLTSLRTDAFDKVKDLSLPIAR